MNEEEFAEGWTREQRKAMLGSLLLTAILLIPACGTVAPKPVEAHQASWTVENGKAVQNSGIVGSDSQGYHVDDGYLSRWDDMLPKFGGFLSPARQAGSRDGISPEPVGNAFYKQGARWVFTVPAREAFHQMNAARKIEEAP